MESLLITATDESPAVEFNLEKNIFSIKGRSLSEDAYAFYSKLIHWIDGLKNASVSNSIEFHIHLEYFNTAASKMLLDLIQKIAEVKASGKNVTVLWYHFEGDVDMVEAAEELSELGEIPFTLIPVK